MCIRDRIYLLIYNLGGYDEYELWYSRILIWPVWLPIRKYATYTLQTMVGVTIAPCIRPISGLLVDVINQQQTVFGDFLIPHLSVVRPTQSIIRRLRSIGTEILLFNCCRFYRREWILLLQGGPETAPLFICNNFVYLSTLNPALFLIFGTYTNINMHCIM